MSLDKIRKLEDIATWIFCGASVRELQLAIRTFDESISRHRINPTFFINETKIGHAILDIDSERKTIEWIRFYPLYEFNSYNINAYHSVQRKGMGTIAHLECLRLAKNQLNNVNDYSVLHHHVSQERGDHLEKMRIYPRFDRLKFSEYLDLSINYAQTKGIDISRYKGISTEKYINEMINNT